MKTVAMNHFVNLSVGTTHSDQFYRDFGPLFSQFHNTDRTLLVFEVLQGFLDEGLIAAKEGGDTESFLGDGVGVVFDEGIIHEEVDVLWREGGVCEVFAEASNTQTTAGDSKLGIVSGDEREGVAGDKYIRESLHDGLALDGVGGASRLVDKDEETLRGAELHHLGDFYYFRCERREAVHLVLLVAYAEDDVVDEGDGGGLGRDIHAELG